MKYAIPFLMVILTMSFFACKKKKDNDTPAPEVQRLAASFTGMKTWRYKSSYIVSHSPDRDTTVYGTRSFAVSYVKGDTINIDGNKLWFDFSDGDSSSRFALHYKGYQSYYGPIVRYSASFVHTLSGDTISYSKSDVHFGVRNLDDYATP